MDINVRELAESVRDYMVSMRREFHQYPELSGLEFETCKRVKRELNAMGLVEGQDYINFEGTNGIMVTLKGGRSGKTLMLRCDMDALSGNEESDVDFCSKVPGVMHACAHDGHMAMMLAAIKVLLPMKEQLAGTIKCLFEPAEETGKGALSMIEHGALEGVDSIFAIHLWSTVPVGKISAEAGPKMAGCEFFRITMKGKSAHGATPHLGQDAAVASAALLLNLQQIVSRRMDPTKSAVITVGYMGAGVQRNTIAEEAFLEGTTRTFSEELMDESNENCFKHLITKVTQATAEAYGVEGCVEQYWMGGYPVVNTPECSEIALKSVEKILGADANMIVEPLSAGENYSYYVRQVPMGGCFALVGVGNPEIGADWPHHNVHFKIDEEGMFNGLMLNIQYALDWSELYAE